MPALEIRLLGEFALAYDGVVLTAVDSARLQAVLAYLILHRQAPQPRRQLAFLFWPDSSERQARTNLRQLLHRLRHALPAGSFVQEEGQSICWDPASPWTADVEQFTSALAAARRAERAGDRAALRAALEQATAAYQGDLLPGHYDDWLLAERERLRELYAEALEQLIDELAGAHEYRRAIGYARRLVRHDPVREPAYRSLMRLHIQSGDRSSAQRVFHACEAALQRHLDAEPSPATHAVLAEPTGVEAPGRPAPAAPARRGGGLPLELDSFVGREPARRAIADALGATRLLTLIGPAGSGKTRLALRLAHSLAERFADGVRWIELEQLPAERETGDELSVVRQVAATLGVAEEPERSHQEVLVEALRPRHALLVLDNCEHCIAGVARLALAVLRTCPEVRILASSREALGVPGETAWPVPPLAFPDPARLPGLDELSRYEAIRLFVDRAEAALPGFRLGRSNAPAVARICARLDGLPLAIELAASRIRMLPAEQIAERLHDALRLLRGNAHTGLARHQTLQAAIDWSDALLSAGERALLYRLAVFVGGFTLAAAEHVCAGGPAPAGAILDLLAQLIDKSLVAAREDERAGEARYRLLDVVRQYAQAKLLDCGEPDAVRQRHGEWCLSLAERAAPELAGPDQEAWLAQLEAEHDNLQAALRRYRDEGEVERGLRLAAALWRFWYVRGYVVSGWRWLEALLPVAGQAAPATRAKAQHAAGALAWAQGLYPRASALFEDAAQLYRQLQDRPGLAMCLNSLAVVVSGLQDFERGVRLAQESLTLYEELGDVLAASAPLNNLADIAFYQGEYATAGRYYERALDIYRRQGNAHDEALTRHNLGCVARGLGDRPGARRHFEASLALFRRLQSKYGVAHGLRALADLAVQDGQGAQARAGYAEALHLFEELAAVREMVVSLLRYAALALAEGRPEPCARLLAAVDAACRERHVPLPPDEVTEHERCQAAARALLAPERWQALWAEGQALTLADAIAVAPAT